MILREINLENISPIRGRSTSVLHCKPVASRIWFALVFWSTFHSIGAQAVDFEINWRAGEKRLISYEMQVAETENGVAKTPYTSQREIKLEVLEEMADGYLIGLSLENPMLPDLRDFTGEVLTAFELGQLNIRVFVNRFNGNHDVQNPDEVILQMRQERETIERALSQEDDELKYLFPIIAGETIHLFQTVGGINEYLGGRLHYLLLPFRYEFQTGDTIAVRGKRQNPIDMNREDPYTSLFFLEKTKNSHFFIHEETESDMSSFIEAVKKIEIPALEPNPDDPGEDRKAAFAEFSSHSVISFDASSAWVNEVQAKNRIRKRIPLSDSFDTIVSIQIYVEEIRQ